MAALGGDDDDDDDDSEGGSDAGEDDTAAAAAMEAMLRAHREEEAVGFRQEAAAIKVRCLCGPDPQLSRFEPASRARMALRAASCASIVPPSPPHTSLPPIALLPPPCPSRTNPGTLPTRPLSQVFEEEASDDWVASLKQQRAEARAANDWAKADSIRDQLKAAGVSLDKDAYVSAGGTPGSGPAGGAQLTRKEQKAVKRATAAAAALAAAETGTNSKAAKARKLAAAMGRPVRY